MIDFTISEEERILADTARRFGDDHLRDAERDHEKAQAYMPEVHQIFEEMGLAGLNSAEAGLEAAHRIAVWGALSEADPAAPFALDPVGPGGVVLEEIPEGVGAIAYIEKVQISGDRATGRLGWIPRSHIDWLVLIAEDGLWQIDAPPYTALETRACGLQAAGGIEVNLEDTPCSRIGGPEAAQLALDECRTMAATVMMGAARDAHAAAARYAQERVAFGRPIAHHQGLAFQLADAATNLQAAGLLVEASIGNSTMVANAHAFAVEVAQAVCERSVQTLGGHGYLYDHRVEKRMRDVRAVASLYGGPILSEHHAAAGILDLPDPLELSS